jgi:DNA-binding response OmpR family regulator
VESSSPHSRASTTRIRSIQAGHQMHLPKPFEPLELLALIASFSGHYDKAQ